MKLRDTPIARHLSLPINSILAITEVLPPNEAECIVGMVREAINAINADDFGQGDFLLQAAASKINKYYEQHKQTTEIQIEV